MGAEKQGTAGMKKWRRAKIEQIIERQCIDTQTGLLAALRQEGIDVTQATVSRDIRELKLVKVATFDGGYRYSLPSGKKSMLP